MFSQEVLKSLLWAGWHSNRKVLKKLKLPKGFDFPDIALKILDEFGDLKIGDIQQKKGTHMAKSSIQFSPILADGEEGTFEDFSNALGVKLCPLGEVNGGYSFLAVDECGKIYILEQDIFIVGNDIQEGIETLIKGAQIQKLNV